MLLEAFDTPYGNIEVRRNSSGDINYYQNGYWMSSTNKGGYTNAIYSRIRECKSVLILGCAGGDLVNLLDCKTDVVDINPISFDIAKKYFNLRNNKVRCITSCAYDYLIKTNKKYDAIVLDCFDERGQIPEILISDKFFKAMIDKVNTVIAINTCCRRTSDITNLLDKNNLTHKSISHCIFAYKQ